MTDLSKAPIEPQEFIEFLKKEIQLKPISQKILHQKVVERAAQDREITVSEEEVQEESDRFRRDNRLEKAEDTLAWLEAQMISPEDWERGIRDRLLQKKLAASLFDKDVDKFFAENRLDFQKLLLYQLIVPSEEFARELFYQIEEREISFYEAAHFYDIDERRRILCGCEGKVPRSSLPPEIAAAIFRVSIGDIVGPVKTEAGYHLLLVEELIQPELTPEIRQQIIDRMFAQWLVTEVNYMIHNELEAS